jgi:hypothetical protein
MTCMRIPGGYICSGITGDPRTCRELVMSQGRSCRKCPAKDCEAQGKYVEEVRRLVRTEWKVRVP